MTHNDTGGEEPGIGTRSGEYICVCHGDDKPDEWVGWLDGQICDLGEIESLGETFGIPIDDENEPWGLYGWQEFCSQIGVTFDSTFWEGSMISGIFHVGWIKSGTERVAEKKGAKILEKLRANMEKQLRQEVLEELALIEDLDEFIERTKDDRPDLRRRISELEARLKSTASELESSDDARQESARWDTSRLDEACVRLACAVIRKEYGPVVAGPLVLWEGVIYGLISRGGVSLPPGSSPMLVIRAIEASGAPVVRVKEMTVIGGFTSGPNYRKGSEHVSEWENVWIEEETRDRRFLAESPEQEAKISEMHKQLTRMNSTESGRDS